MLSLFYAFTIIVLNRFNSKYSVIEVRSNLALCIGATKAEAIIAYRDVNCFKTIEKNTPKSAIRLRFNTVFASYLMPNLIPNH